MLPVTLEQLFPATYTVIYVPVLRPESRLTVCGAEYLMKVEQILERTDWKNSE